MAIELPVYTVADLDGLPDDGNRYELLNGVLLVTPAPTLAHQVIANRFQVHLTNALGQHAHVTGPGAITAQPKTQLQPDVLVFPSRFPLTAKWEEVDEHWLAIEILSRSSRVYDREFKCDAYFALGAQEVWLVDVSSETVEVCRARGPGTFVRDVVRWQAPSVSVIVSIDLREIFDGLEAAAE